jgi:hypothetical protein
MSQDDDEPAAAEPPHLQSGILTSPADALLGAAI